jgi:dynein heavy chain
VLVDDAIVANWIREGLPSDPTSIQNGTILTNSERWPLMMDPQLQGIVWIKERESKNSLQVLGCRALMLIRRYIQVCLTACCVL